MNQHQLLLIEEEMRRKIGRYFEGWHFKKYGVMDDAIDNWAEIIKRGLEQVPVSDRYL